MKVPLFNSLIACCSSAWVFITIGPCHATGSFKGFPEISRNRTPFGPACTTTSNPVGVKVEKEYDGREVEIRDLSGNRTLVLFDRGDEVVVNAGPKGVRFLLISGKPLKEPVAWHGPIVMNTQAELQQAIKELNNGTFIKTGSAEHGY